MPEYMLDDTAEPLTVSFTPLHVVMAAHFVHFSITETDTAGSAPEVEMKPVLGVFLRHDVNIGGQVTGSRQEMAVQLEDTQELCTPDEYVKYCGHGTKLIGVWNYKIKPEPTAEDIEEAVALGRRLHATSVARKAKKAGAAA